MRTKAIIKKALKNVEREIGGQSAGKTGTSLFYARGLSREGYAGGYSDALNDVLLLLNKVMPTRRNYWPTE